MSDIWARFRRPANPISWGKVGLLFLTMMVTYLALCILSPRLRHQMESAHSLYWTFTFPLSVGCMVIFALALRLAGRVNAYLSSGSTSNSNS
jgi:hypothetical protein